MVVRTRDTLRFQFIIGTLPEDTKAGKNIEGNMTVTYHVPYNPEHFSISSLRGHVESEHEENMKQAARTKNEHKRYERSGIARMSVDSVRDWFKHTDASIFNEAVEIAVATNTTACLDHVKYCRLAITPQHSDAVLM